MPMPFSSSSDDAAGEASPAMKRGERGVPRAPGQPDSPDASRSRLLTSIQYVKGVGPKRALLFERLGVSTVKDLLYLAPRRYIDRGCIVPMNRVRVGALVTVAGTVLDVEFRTISRGRSLVKVLVGDGSGVVQAVWFNQPYRADTFREGQRVVLSGKAVLYDGGLQMNAPDFEVLAEDSPARFAEGVVAVYPATEGLSQWMIRRVVREAVERFGDDLTDPLPAELRRRNGLVTLKRAIAHLHFPPDMAAARAAVRRLKFDELFTLQMGLALRRHRLRLASAEPIHVDERIDARIRRRFPFTLTGAQERVIREIREDLARDRPMNRLLQGDVGSGKTVVAVYAMLAAVANRLQAAVMAPTAVLAEQHFAGIDRMLKGSRVRRALLLGGMPAAERRRLTGEIAAGRIDIVVGTHAVIQRDISFARLGLVVVDEQHKFGVAQRAMLRRKAKAPHCLVMTATPIPRTLAMSAFGDLDLSVLDEMPPGRRPVETRYIPRERAHEAFQFIREEIRKGRQAYFVYPLIDDSDRLALRSAKRMYRTLKERIYPDLKVGLLHGRMKPGEKERVMADFRTRRIHILVSTVVIEVGIDVPNATLMVIDHAERFGLAQLHQLRGRVGRDVRQAYAYLILPPGQAITPTANVFRIPSLGRRKGSRRKSVSISAPWAKMVMHAGTFFGLIPTLSSPRNPGVRI